eukprot:3215673-Amphidinium_carterae.1
MILQSFRSEHEAKNDAAHANRGSAVTDLLTRSLGNSSCIRKSQPMNKNNNDENLAVTAA